jgi:hypothetical protein
MYFRPFFFLPLILVPLHAQAVDTIPSKTAEKEYSLIIQDTPSALFTMRQSNESFLSIYRLGVNEINRHFPRKTAFAVQAVLSSIFFLPLTHEEGHRSILTNEGIGSISKPYFNIHGAAYVAGVSDATLIALRNNNLPVYTRIYTAGLESDYALLLREKSLLSWKEDSYDVLWVEYFMRKISLVSYYAMGLFHYNIGLQEENDELKRDIAGHDVYGAIRSLYHPTTMEFKRYVDYKDLLPDERRFVKRVGWRSFINLLDPSLLLRKDLKFKNRYFLNFGFGYSMAPFGDFIDEHFWLKTNDLKLHLYFRQYENQRHWFPAGGVDVAANPLKNLYTTVALHGWLQPKDFSFTQPEGQFGGAVDILCKYRFPIHRKNSRLTGVSVNVSLIAKTQGFLPEEVVMNRHWGLRLGTSIWVR